ncbi:MAG: hypothetical protein COZ06_18305 [Armatimonadetes bacterium CG_4_10_14_3_um_filter_66_18]|nr:hypothetical protein [Armatimonadota bacterium]OIP09374.1 MAG: hypothetical protein AUJ96_05285 [Armatimonadetes bacterium CG2_30_66_41]PIU92003.1 MAG: hypothetical protein COS65_20055 [Armatimonadetes bacterium CG06_land_8_20_14_3_00_66_21]PIX43375.1 MAG: hypothetical protein COZ57_19410 [Armatimonadetes bacterium CG_4_8_14_3_um_filter_66_20]PIY46685.1 MAG: hypothetical protein COZ06_18305 [Armatimonadetes bacterium CG_4_10_14_3_um_filter_66_18]PIZ32197.1 MAG: hypothetical protein COY42_31
MISQATQSLQLLLLLTGGGCTARAQAKPIPPRIDSVVLAPVQPHEGDSAVLWYDNFDGPEAT